MIWQYLSEGFLLGISTGYICLAMCGPVYAPFLMLRKMNLKQSFFNILQLSVGRFIIYLSFGLLAGFFGKQIGEFNREWFTAFAYIAFSSFLLISALRTHRKEHGCAVSKWSKFSDNPFLLGLFTGINFCPSFLIALTRAIDLSGPLSGAMLFIAFFFGTNIFLVPLMFFGVMGNKKAFRTAAVVSAFVVSAWFCSKAIISLYQLITHKESIFVSQEIIEQSDSTQTEIPLEDSVVAISIMDSTTAYILTPDSSKVNSLQSALQNIRKGPVVTITADSLLPQKGYIFVDNAWSSTSGKTFKSLKKGERFIIVLAKTKKPSTYSHAEIEKVLSFFGHYYFKLDKVNGSIFFMDKSSSKE